MHRFLLLLLCFSTLLAACDSGNKTAPTKSAAQILTETLPWSQRYHPQMPAGVKQMADYARNPQPPAASKKE